MTRLNRKNKNPHAILVESAKENYIIEQWNKEDIQLIHAELEKPHWAPWLSFSEKGMQEMASIFPEGQLIVKDKNGSFMAYASTNRINWDGKVKTLPTWDEAAGGQVEQASYQSTYKANGNTLIIMCITVHSMHRGKFLSSILLYEIKRLARDLKVKHIISPFRPSTYGFYKQHHHDPGFKAYCALKREDGMPVDTWLRILIRNGMKPLIVRDNSLVVEVSKAEFKKFKTYHNKELWKEISPNVWECGEVGRWYVGNEKAVYKEPELFGKLPLS